MLKRGNFGSGNIVLDGFENYDLNPSNNRVNKLDMNILPYRFDDNCFDELVCRHTLEHLDVNAYSVMREFHRISKPNSSVIIELPIFGNLVSHNRFLHSRNYMNPILFRRFDNEYISNLFILKSFSKKQKCSMRKILWKMKTRFFTWVDSFRYDSYEWELGVKK